MARVVAYKFRSCNKRASHERQEAKRSKSPISKRKPGDETGVEYFINNYNMEVGDAKMWAAKVFKPKEFNTNYRLLKHFNYLTFIALLVTFSLVRNNYWPFEPIADVITYTAALSACEKARRWEAALALLAAAPDRTVVTFNAAIPSPATHAISTQLKAGERWLKTLLKTIPIA